jgi:hypothetical protein
MGNPLTKPARDTSENRKSLDGRTWRFELLRTAQRVLNRKDARIEEQHATVWCMRSVQSGETNIRVFRARDGSDASVHGVQTCKNVHTCPVCSVRIGETRRAELQHAMDAWTKEGGAAYLLTLTFAHRAGDPLGTLLERFEKALVRFKSGRDYRRILKEQYERIGSVRGLEITHGVNGWHPHTHDLTFARAGLVEDAAAVRALRRGWMLACLQAGLIPGARLVGKGRAAALMLDVSGDERDAGNSLDALIARFEKLEAQGGEPQGWGAGATSMWHHWRHALDLRGGEKASQYVAKFGKWQEEWNLASELARSYQKVGVRRAQMDSGSHCTPFQLLVFAAEGDAEAGSLFREYADAIHGRRALSWSPGLKKRFGVADMEDGDIPEDDQSERIEWATILPGEWSLILSRGDVGGFLRYVAEFCTVGATAQDDVIDYIRSLKARPAVARGDVRHRSPATSGGFDVITR